MLQTIMLERNALSQSIVAIKEQLQNVGVLQHKALVCVFKQSFISTEHSHHFLTARDKNQCSAKISNENREKGSDMDGKKKKSCGRSIHLGLTEGNYAEFRVSCTLVTCGVVRQ